MKQVMCALSSWAGGNNVRHRSTILMGYDEPNFDPFEIIYTKVVIVWFSANPIGITK